MLDVTIQKHLPRLGMKSRGAASPRKSDERLPRRSTLEDDGNLKTKLLCAACRALVTFQDAGMEVRGSFEHTFCNPHGLVFHIGCFFQAPGCRLVGPASADFTWFSGHTWCIACCSRCQTHLGWLFQGSEGAFFYALILDRLIEAGQGDQE